MHVKNHMAMWSLWSLWILCVEYSENQLYKPLCAFLVFVDLVRFLWLGGLAIDADGCASDRAHVVFVARWSCPN